MTLLHLFWEVISYHKYSETTSTHTSSPSLSTHGGGAHQAPSWLTWVWRQQRAAAHRSLHLLSVEPPLSWDICRRRSWEPPATSISTRTTCSTWRTNTGKVTPPLCTSAHNKRAQCSSVPSPQFSEAKRRSRLRATSSKPNRAPTRRSKASGLASSTRGPKKWSS